MVYIYCNDFKRVLRKETKTLKTLQYSLRGSKKYPIKNYYFYIYMHRNYFIIYEYSIS